MYGVIASPTYIEDINQSLDQVPYFIKAGNFDADTFISHIQAASRISLNVLLIDVTCVSEEGILKGIRLFRVQKSLVRIILVAPGFEPGNSTISSLVGLGIHDIVAPSLPEINIEEQNEEIEFNISSFIKERLLNPGTYADVVRWHTVEEYTYSEESKKNNESSKLEKLKPEIKTEYVVEQKFITIPTNTIAVLNLSSKAGSSFISMNLAKAFDSYNLSVSVLDNPLYRTGKARLFDILGLELQDINTEEFYSVPHAIKNDSRIQRERFYTTDNIQWMITDSRCSEITAWSYEETMKYIHSSKSTVTIFDIGNISPEDDTFKKIIQEVDLALVVIDPIPQEILANRKLFSYFISLQEQGINIEFIFNRWNDGVDVKSLNEDEIGIQSPIKVPFIEPSLIYQAIYMFYIPYENEEVKAELEEPFFQLMKMVIPTLEKQNKQKKGFGLKRFLQRN